MGVVLNSALMTVWFVLYVVSHCIGPQHVDGIWPDRLTPSVVAALASAGEEMTYQRLSKICGLSRYSTPTKALFLAK